MPKLARSVVVGFAHHITQRGNNRQDVFFVDDDRRVYLDLLKEQAEKYALEIIGYCLMNSGERSLRKVYLIPK
jgi:putative transposase